MRIREESCWVEDRSLSHHCGPSIRGTPNNTNISINLDRFFAECVAASGRNEGGRGDKRETVVTVLNLIISIVFILVNLWALTRVIDKAGLSRLWLLLPLLSVGLTIACAVETYSEVHGAPSAFSNEFFGWSQLKLLWHGDTISPGFEQGALLWHVDLISIGANWLLFILFAVVPWGLDRGQAKGSSESRVTGPLTTPRPSATAGAKGPRGVTRDYGPSAGAPATVAAPAPTAAGPVTKYCVWCAEALPGSRALFHDCGPKSRPPIFCAKCGSTLTAVGDCASCGVAS